MLVRRYLSRCGQRQLSQFVVQSKYICPELNSSLAKKSFPRFILDKVGKYGEDVAIIDGSSQTSEDSSHTFASFHRSTYRLGTALRKLNVGPGKCVAIVSPNHIDYHVALLGIGLTGAHSTLANPMLTVDELKYQLELTSAQAIVAHSSVAGKVAEATNHRIPIYSVDKPAANSTLNAPIVGSIRDLIAGESFEKIDLESLQGNGTDSYDNSSIFTIPFSSGTTGRPKGVMITHQSFVANILQVLAIDGNITRAPRMLPLPYYHIYGSLAAMVVNYIGAVNIFMTSFDLVRFLELMQKYSVERASLVPPIVLALAKHPIVSKYNLDALKTIACGAAPLGDEIQKLASQRLQCVVKQGWGMTELSGCGTLIPDEIVKKYGDSSPEVIAGSIGMLLPGCEAKFVDPLTGETLPITSEGELCLRGPNIMKGYLNNEVATRETIDEDGWLHTGDVAKMNQHGCFFITDRCKELIKYKGSQVAPAELEALIASMVGVKDCVVIPVADEEAGEIPRAYVVRQDDASGQALTPEAVEAFVREKVAPHKRLRGGVRFTDVVPKTPSGKILRRVQRDLDRAIDQLQKAST